MMMVQSSQCDNYNISFLNSSMCIGYRLPGAAKIASTTVNSELVNDDIETFYS